MNRYVAYERKTITAMIQLYCHKKHRRKNSVCPECDAMIDYALCRLKNCRYGNLKPVCGRCPNPCYTPEMRRQIKQIMRKTRPWMPAYHPMLTLYHLLHLYTNK